MDSAKRRRLLSAYERHAARFDSIAERRAVGRGPLPPVVRERAPGAEPVVSRERARAANLTDRRTEVLALLATGASNAEIAEKLRVSTETVKSHVKALLIALDARTRAHAVTLAFCAGILTVPWRSGASLAGMDADRFQRPLRIAY